MDADLNLKDDNVTLAETTYGWYGGLEDPNAAQTTAGHKASNFNAAGTAPNHFTGETVVNNILASRVEMHVQEENVDLLLPWCKQHNQWMPIDEQWFCWIFNNKRTKLLSLNRSGTDGDIVVFRKNGVARLQVLSLLMMSNYSPNLVRTGFNTLVICCNKRVKAGNNLVSFEYNSRSRFWLMVSSLTKGGSNLIHSVIHWNQCWSTEPLTMVLYADYDGTAILERQTTTSRSAVSCTKLLQGGTSLATN